MSENELQDEGVKNGEDISANGKKDGIVTLGEKIIQGAYLSICSYIDSKAFYLLNFTS